MVRINPLRSPLARLVYLIIVIGLAVAVWFLIPDEVKQTVRDTYVDPDRAGNMTPR